MTDEEIFAVISKNWPDKNVKNIQSYIHQEYRDVAAEAGKLERRDVAKKLRRAMEIWSAEESWDAIETLCNLLEAG